MADYIYVNGELYHYGVLGMKWGVRRYQPYPKGKHGTFLGQTRDEDIVIKKGTTATRLQTGKSLAGEGQTYVSFDKIDSLRYAAVTSGEGPGSLCVNMRDGSGNIVTLKLQNDIVAPSYQKTMDAFIKTVDEMGVKQMAKDTFNYKDESLSKPTRERYKRQAKQFIKDYKHLSVDECRDRAYESFTNSFMRDTKARKMFFDTLKDDGYNAIIDENDKHFGNDSFSNAPMIVFDRSDLKVTKSTSISETDANYFADVWFNGTGDRAYLEKHHGSTVDKWDKWAGISKRNYG